MKTENTRTAETSREGKIIEVKGDRLTTSCEKGEERSYTIAKEARITCDGRDAKLADLKKGAPVRVTTAKDDKNKVLSLECGEFAPVATRA